MPKFKVLRPILQGRKTLLKDSIAELPDTPSTKALVRTGFVEPEGQSQEPPPVPDAGDAKAKGKGK